MPLSFGMHPNARIQVIVPDNWARFKSRERPWISTENASKERIIEQVGKCPSGALSMKG